MIAAIGVEVSADDLASRIYTPSLRIHGTRVMNREERAALEDEAVDDAIASIPAHNGALRIDACGARIVRSGKVESCKCTAAEEEPVSWPGPSTIVTHDVTCVIDPINKGNG